MKELFDKAAYGVRLRVKRKKHGYRRGKDFCSDVKKQTGLDIDTDVLYRIERGEQAPTVDQIFAFNFVLKYGEVCKLPLLQCEGGEMNER